MLNLNSDELLLISCVVRSMGTWRLADISDLERVPISPVQSSVCTIQLNLGREKVELSGFQVALFQPSSKRLHCYRFPPDPRGARCSCL